MSRQHPYHAAQRLFGEDAGQTETEAFAREEENAFPLPEPELQEPPFCPRCKAAEENAARVLAEAEDTRLRALAECDNLRKRLLREKEEAGRYLASAVLSDILPSLDNLDLALEHAGNNEACKDLITGVEMTRKLLLDSLRRHGLEQVGEAGEPFDPGLHEAVSTVSRPDLPEGSIAVLLSRGYKLHDRLLRPARVAVCKQA
jgi:molecular chaperone GrpE